LPHGDSSTLRHVRHESDKFKLDKNNRSSEDEDEVESEDDFSYDDQPIRNAK